MGSWAESPPRAVRFLRASLALLVGSEQRVALAIAASHVRVRGSGRSSESTPRDEALEGLG